MDKCLFKAKNESDNWIGINGHNKIKKKRKPKGSGTGVASSSSKKVPSLGLTHACPSLTKETGEACRRPTGPEREQYNKLYHKCNMKSRRAKKPTPCPQPH